MSKSFSDSPFTLGKHAFPQLYLKLYSYFTVKGLLGKLGII